MTIDIQIPDWMDQSSIDGVIARLDSRTVDAIRDLDVPCVDVRCSRKFDGIPQVETDDGQVAELAFEHLRDRGFQKLAFCGFRNAHFSDARLEAFSILAQKNGCELSVYETTGDPTASTITGLEQSGNRDIRGLSTWLKSLPHPTGLFVCNDIRGQQVLNACRKLGIAVPDDIAVIGCDDDDTICPLSDPPLSSVRPNARQVGYRAAEILESMLAGHAPEHSIEYIRPLSVVERISTQVVAVDDREIARVCRFIRQHACDGINVHDVAAFSRLSRRQLERRFRKELGRTPHEEIIAIQMDRAKRLLRETDLTLEQLAPLIGYRHKEQLGTIFRRECGETPGEYRSRNRSNDD